MLKKQPTDYLGMGVRIGWTEFNQSASDIIIDINGWPTYNTSIESKSYNAYWFEVSLGIKGEIFKNVYLGWSGLVKIRFSGGNDSSFQPYDIPGFGNSEKKLRLGVNYYILYQIPFNRNK